MSFSDDYKMEYKASDDADCNTIHFRLTHSNYPASSLPTATISGLWLGIGLRSPVMADADYYSCSYVYTTNDANNFTFHDWVYQPSIDGDGNFNFDEVQNFESTETVAKDRAAGTYTCEFSRLRDTGDTEHDYMIPINTEFDMIAAFGPV